MEKNTLALKIWKLKYEISLQGIGCRNTGIGSINVFLFSHFQYYYRLLSKEK